MKKILYLVIPLLISVIAFGIILLSDSAIPGDFFYVFDRQIEKAQLIGAKFLGKVPYARLNLDLAGERLVEIQSLATLRKPVTSFVFKAHAQTVDEGVNEVDTLILQLIEDFRLNILEVTAILGDDSVSNLELSKEIAEKTTDFSSELLVLLPKLEENEIEKLDEVSDDIEKLDEDAVDDLLEDSEEDDDSQRIATEKVSKTLLKVVEKVASLVEKLDNHKEKMSTSEIKVVTDGIATINLKIASARTLLSQGSLDEAYVLLKETKDEVSKLRDLMDQEEEAQEREREREREQEEEEEKDSNKKDDDEKENRNGSTGSTSKSGSGSSKTDDGEQEREQEQEEEDEQENEREDKSNDEEDVEGAFVKVDTDNWVNYIF